MNEKPTILIVDDDYAGREAIRGVLMMQGYQLIEAVDGQSALDLAQEHIPDLILLDVMMPRMDGYEVCRRLRADPILHEIPILMLTALDDRDSRLRGIDVGADDFISKPYDRTELRARVRTITRLNRYRHLLLERARFVWVVENDQDGYLILDENGKIDFANAVARSLFSLPDEEEVGSTGVTFLERAQERFICVPPERWSTWPEIEAQETPLYIIRPQDDQNRPLWFEVHILDLPWLSKIQRLLRIKDVTQTCSLTFETWAFHTAAQHKLVTPVTNMNLSIELVKILTGNLGLSKDIMDCIETIEAGTQRLVHEIKDVLQYINAPVMQLAGDRLQVAEMDAIVRKAAVEMGLSRVSFAMDTPALANPSIPLSCRTLQIVLWELFENAKKFHPQQDPCVDVCISYPKPGEISLKIVDDGVWVPLEHLDHVFKPYYQGEKTYTGEINGMGLGLSTVAAITWQAGGNIHLQNRRERPGVAIEMRFPLGKDTHSPLK